jgi:hypothetical protein
MTLIQKDHTATMAKIYADQGYLRKAAQIYRYLLVRNPDQDDVRQALSALEQELARRPVPSRKELGLLFKEWIYLLNDLRNHKRLHEGTGAGPAEVDRL